MVMGAAIGTFGCLVGVVVEFAGMAKPAKISAAALTVAGALVYMGAYAKFIDGIRGRTGTDGIWRGAPPDNWDGWNLEGMVYQGCINPVLASVACAVVSLCTPLSRAGDEQGGAQTPSLHTIE